MKNFNILAIDTALNRCSVAIQYNGKLTQKIADLPNERTINILNITKELLQEINVSELSFFAFSAGPGSFTGLKIASSIIQALRICNPKPIMKVSTLQALSLHAYEKFGADLIMPCIDAKMGQMYYGIYEIKKIDNHLEMIILQQDSIAAIAEINLPKKNILLVGDGSQYLYETLSPNNLNKYINVQSNLISYNADHIIKIANYKYINYDIINDDAIPIYLHAYK